MKAGDIRPSIVKEMVVRNDRDVVPDRKTCRVVARYVHDHMKTVSDRDVVNIYHVTEAYLSDPDSADVREFLYALGIRPSDIDSIVERQKSLETGREACREGVDDNDGRTPLDSRSADMRAILDASGVDVRDIGSRLIGLDDRHKKIIGDIMVKREASRADIRRFLKWIGRDVSDRMIRSGFVFDSTSVPDLLRFVLMESRLEREPDGDETRNVPEECLIPDGAFDMADAMVMMVVNDG